MKSFGVVSALVVGLAVTTLYASPNAASAVMFSNLSAGQTLGPGESVSSDDGSFTLLYQDDGNLVLYSGAGALWSTGTVGTEPGFASMQGDGNFVVYDASGNAVWASNTFGDGNWLAVQNDGNVVIYDAGGNALWATGTSPTH